MFPTSENRSTHKYIRNNSFSAGMWIIDSIWFFICIAPFLLFRWLDLTYSVEAKGCCLYSIDVFTLAFLSFEHHLKHSYFWLELWWERFGFTLDSKVALILAAEICECLVSFVLLVMKYSCLMNKLFMPLSHFNFLILDRYEYLNCLCGVELRSCWEESTFFPERGACHRGCCRMLLTAAQMVSS